MSRIADLIVIVSLFLATSCAITKDERPLCEAGTTIPVTFNSYGGNTSLSFLDCRCAGKWQPQSGPWYICE